MIEPAYVQTMARYNAWQNSQLVDGLQGASHAVLTLDRRSFFGSILGTLNHILWGDQMWMSRFDPSIAKPNVSIPESVELTKTLGEWSAERFVFDGKIKIWAAGTKAIDLRGKIQFYSNVLGAEVERPLAPCVTHFFNHQTHHRGQVHAMMTAAGLKAPVSDLFLMPDDA